MRPVIRLVLLLMLACYLVTGRAVVSAHPLDALLHDLRLRLAPETLTLQGRIVVGPLVAARVWDEADQDADGRISQAEATAWGGRYLAQMDLLIDGARLPLSLSAAGITFPATRADFVGGASSAIQVSARARLPALAPGEYVLEATGAAYADISAYDFKALGSRGLAIREATSVTAKGARFPLLVKQAAQQPAVQDPPAARSMAAEGEEVQLQQRIGDSKLLAWLRAGEAGPGFVLMSLAAALVFGALHALQPGHGKTLVAAYLVGSRGTVRHAIALGGIVTFTHTASVLLLGFLLLAFTQLIKPERILPGLTALSGLLVVGLGLNLFWSRLRSARGGGGHHEHHHYHRRHEHAHTHDEGEQLAADQHDEHSHHHPHAHGHSHALPERITARSLVALGVSGGIVPCTEALVILIVAVALSRLLLGLLMIIAFSLGLAAVLIGIGVALVTVGKHLQRTPLSNPRLAGRLAMWVPVLSAALVTVLGLALTWQGIAGL